MLTSETAAGQEFAGRRKRVSWVRLWAFSGGPFALEGWPGKNLHTDAGIAAACGLRSVAASGTQYEGYVCELLVDLLGENWLRTGTLKSKFIALVGVNDLIQPKAVVTSKRLEGNSVTFSFDVRCENQHGVRVLMGTATGRIESPPGSVPAASGDTSGQTR